ncbi:MAG: leucine-rich repeat domain-containing protein [Clostridia bacterium]|nr:leucine-rich repeat domain-containing protein [Clostridia bacterium]
MKKWIALCLAVCMSIAVFTSCDGPNPTETTDPLDTAETYPKAYAVDNGLLTTCIGQADENGVYVVPETITAIAESAFAGDEKLKEVVIGSHVKMIGSGAFRNCTSLQKVVIEDGVEEIGSYAFYDCVSLKEISLPSTVDYLNQYTFYGCTSLESISLDHIRYIDDSAFWSCSALERVTLSEDLEYLGNWVFAQCNNLSDINLGELRRLEKVGDYAFMGCSMLLSVTIPSCIKTVGKLTFYDCTRLSHVEIADTVQMVDYAAFNYTPWYQENTEDYLIVGDGILIKCTVHPNFIDLTDKPIKTIGGTAFWNATAEDEAAEYGYKYATELETLVLPETVTTIGTSAFGGCYNLKEIVLPAGVTEIGDGAFNIYIEGIETEANVDFTKCQNLKSIGSYAFQGCYGIASFDLPKSVETIGAYAFAATDAYESFMDEAAKAEKEEDRYFITGDGILLAAYVADDQTKITVPNGVKKIAGSAFSGWDIAYIPNDVSLLSMSGRSKYNISYSVKEVVLPETLVEIGNSAFYRMLSVESIVLPDSVKFIDAEAFAWCTGLKNVTGGTNIETIGNYAFSYCTNIPGFQFSKNTKNIGVGVFFGCSSIQNVRLPDGLSFPGTTLFNSECTSLANLTMDESARSRIYTILGSVQQDIKVFYE